MIRDAGEYIKMGVLWLHFVIWGWFWFVYSPWGADECDDGERRWDIHFWGGRGAGGWMMKRRGAILTPLVDGWVDFDDDDDEMLFVLQAVKEALLFDVKLVRIKGCIGFVA